MNKTGIEYLDFTWNPLAMLCDPISAGCQNCWHRRRAKMLASNPTIPVWQQRAYAGKSDPALITSRLEQPFKRKKPSIIGVQFMGDLWHHNIDWPMIDQVFEACHKAPQHTYIFLTKRIEAAWYYFNSPVYPEEISGKHRSEYLKSHSNIWFGTSIEDQETADLRINLLLLIPASVRIVSVEPVLEEIKIKSHSFAGQCMDHCETIMQMDCDDSMIEGCMTKRDGIDWVIAGKENGPRARQCPEGAIKNLYSQCKSASIPFFDKSLNYISREFPRT